ncbi:MAG: ABC transporter permease [Nanoarchaeota archaeon]|nr:ABC transporter permease [Nanoarchaeota archaeon]
MFQDYLSFCIDNLRSRKLRSYLTLLGIFIGIAAVVSLISLGQGLRSGVSSQFGFLGPDLIRVNIGSSLAPPGTTVVANPLTQSDVDGIDNIAGVRMVAGRLAHPGNLRFNDRIVFGIALSMPDGEDRGEIEEAIGYEVAKGRLLRDGDSNSVVVGSAVAEEDSFGKEILPGAKVEIEGKAFTVVGVLKSKGSFLFDGSIVLNEEPMRDLFDTPQDQYDMIAIRAEDKDEAEEVRDSIERFLRKERDVNEGEEDFDVETAAAAVENINSILLGINIFVVIIASISLVVGGIGILNTMYTSVLERTKEIGIMKSIGARNSSIFLLFFLESGLLGIVGGIVGVVIGVIGASSMAALGGLALGSDLIQAEFSFGLIFGALLFSFVIGVVFGITPAMQAAKLSPVDALRSGK